MVSLAFDKPGIVLINSLRAGRIVFFAGVGISLDSGLLFALRKAMGPCSCRRSRVLKS